MKKIVLTVFSFLISISVFSQENNTDTTSSAVVQIDDGKKDIRDPWTSTLYVDDQSTYLPSKGSFEILIQHRFTNIDNGIKDLFGLYGASNIMLAINYSIFDRWMIGFGTEKDKKYQEFYTKVKILGQNRNNSIPVSLSFIGNASINAREKEFWGLDYKFFDRLSYFAQLSLSRQFGEVLALQASVSYSHINKVESIKVSDTTSTEIITSYKSLYQNDVIGASAAARVKVYKSLSLMAEYDQGFYLKTAENQQLIPKPNVALGLEIGTSTHSFQIFASSFRGIVPQQNFIENQFDFTKPKGIMLGFNIIVRVN